MSANVEVIETDGQGVAASAASQTNPFTEERGVGRRPTTEMGAVRCKLPCSGPGSLALPCDDPASLSLPQATCSLPTLLSISFPEVQSPEPAIRWEKQWQQSELLHNQHPGACRSPWKPREGRAPRDRQPAPCLLADPHPRYSQVPGK